MKGYLPTLDGWRALSILAVILFHDQPHSVGRLSTAWFQANGRYGVDVFFAISGLLICSRLLVEEESAGRIDLRRFYIRRAFRIFPPAFLYLGIIYLVGRLTSLSVRLPEILASALFLRNYTFTFIHFESSAAYYTVHFWSLAVEEHFYLVLPALLVFVPRRWRMKALLAIAALVLLRAAAKIHAGLFVFTHTDVRLDSLLMPAIIALLLRQEDFRQGLGRWLALWPLLLVLVLAVATWEPFPNFNYLFFPFAMPFLIVGTIARPDMWFSRFLELAPVRWLGKLSYSLYLWQQLFFMRPDAPLGRLNHWPYAPGLALGCAVASHYLVEKPCMRLGHRLAPNVGANKSSEPIEIEGQHPAMHTI